MRRTCIQPTTDAPISLTSTRIISTCQISPIFRVYPQFLVLQTHTHHIITPPSFYLSHVNKGEGEGEGGGRLIHRKEKRIESGEAFRFPPPSLFVLLPHSISQLSNVAKQRFARNSLCCSHGPPSLPLPSSLPFPSLISFFTY